MLGDFAEGNLLTPCSTYLAFLIVIVDFRRLFAWLMTQMRYIRDNFQLMLVGSHPLSLFSLPLDCSMLEQPRFSSCLIITCLLLLEVTALSTVHPRTVRRISAKDFDPSLFYKENNPTTELVEPLLIQDALSLKDCEMCCDLLVQAAPELTVNLQRQNHHDDDNDVGASLETVLYPGIPLLQALDLIMAQSNSRTGLLAFCEGLLEDSHDSSLDLIQQYATRAREQLFHDPNNKNKNDPDWFLHYFPESTQLSDAVILAGAGAVSTLHRDPWAWTGTSLCLEGTKLWRFVPPVPHVQHIDAALESYRLESNAWSNSHQNNDEKNTIATPPPTLSAGWQTDQYSLFHTRQHDTIPTARELNDLHSSDTDDERWQEALQKIAHGDCLQSNLPDKTPPCVTAIQQPGDLLLIPAHWWHQTYGLEPSVSIASQRCGKYDARNVFPHVCNLQTTDALGSDAAFKILDQNAHSPQNAVDDLFQWIANQQVEIGNQ